MEQTKYTFVELLKKYTSIDEEFIDTFLSTFKIGNELEFDIKDKEAANYLGITCQTLRNRLNNKYNTKEQYIKKVDYIKVVTDKTTNKKSYYINYQCFERLAMAGNTEQSELVRLYFVKLREFIYENQILIFQALDNNQDLRKYAGFDTIYFFAVDDMHKEDFFKFGRTSDIIKRLRTYNTGRIRDVDLKYLAIVKNAKLIEKCMKHQLKINQVIKGREIYNVKADTLQQIINNCYTQSVSKDENEELYDEISRLIGFYGYIKDKVRIKPYVIIGKDIVSI